MNVDTDRKRGLKDGDTVELEYYLERKETSTVKLMKGHHSLTVGISNTADHFAKGKGANFNTLLPMAFEHTDPISGNLEIGIKVSIKKIEEKEK